MIDPDDILSEIQSEIPHFKLSWKVNGLNDVISINDVCTKITRKEIKELYSNLRNLSSVRASKKLLQNSLQTN